MIANPANTVAMFPLVNARRGWAPFLSVAVAITAAISSSEAQAVRDSAGVKVVTYAPADDPGERWRIGSTPLLVIGESGSVPTEFSLIAGVVRLPDGSIAVADNGSSELRVFDSTGSHRRTLGGKGRGPGEFPSLWEMWRVQEALVGIDGFGVGQVFSSSGEYLRTTPRHTAPSGRRVVRAGYLSDGTLIAYYDVRDTEPRSGRWTVVATLVKIEKGQQETLGHHPGYERAIRAHGRSRSVVYGPRIQVAVLATNYCVGYSEEYAIRCFDGFGTLKSVIVRTAWQTRSVTTADRRVYFDGMDRANSLPENAGFRAELREITTFSDRMPAFGRFLASANSELWVGPVVPAEETIGLNPSPPDATVWSVYSDGGEWLSDVTLPPGFRLMDAGSDYVLGVVRDADDVERVVQFSLYRT